MMTLRDRLISETSANKELRKQHKELLEACKSAHSLMNDADVSGMPDEAACRFSAIRWQLDVAIKNAGGRA